MRWGKMTYRAKDLIFPNPWTLLNMIADLIASSTLSNSVENPNLSNSEITRQVTPFWDQLASFFFFCFVPFISSKKWLRGTYLRCDYSL